MTTRASSSSSVSSTGAHRAAYKRDAEEAARIPARPFVVLCKALGLAVEAEYRFATPRRWRFDYAIPAADGRGGIALEVQGGLFVNGRHSRGAALLGEHEKLNTAAIMGWKILYTTPRQLLVDGPDLLLKAVGR